MQATAARAALTLSCAALLLALGACGGRVDASTTAQQDHPSVEINRQGEEGATPLTATAQQPAGTPVITHIGNYDMSQDADTHIAAEVHQALMTDADLSSMKIDVSSEDGAVTLRGRAPDPAARTRATEIARNVKDVKSVENELTLG